MQAGIVAVRMTQIADRQAQFAAGACDPQLAAYARAMAELWRANAELLSPRDGDIGEGQEEWEVEPLTFPAAVPVETPATEPAPELVPA